MVKTKMKEKKKKEKKEKKEGFEYEKILKFVFPIVVLITAYIGYHIRMQPSSYKYFIDPDTFYHFELYKLTLREWIPKYYLFSDAPFGSLVGEPRGLYILPAVAYKILSIFGVSAFKAFKMFPPLVGFFSILGVYFLGKKLHSEWTGLWSALIMMFLTASFVRTFSGNNRGDGLFMMLFLFAAASMFYYFEEQKKVLKYMYGAFFVGFGVLSLSAWNGSPFGLMVLLGFGALNAIALFVFGKIEELKAFVRDFYPAYALILIVGYALTPSGIVRVSGHIRFAFEAFMGLFALTLVMLYGERFRLNYEDRLHRLAVVIAIAAIGVVGARLYVGPKIWSLMSGAYQSTQVYETVQELAKTTMNDIKLYYGVKGSDGLIFFLSLAGIGLATFKFFYDLLRENRVNSKLLFLLTFYGMSVYLMGTAVRFLFLASAATILAFAYLIGEIFEYILRMEEKPSTKAMFAVLLILLLVPIPIVGAVNMNNQAKRMGGSVSKSWEETLLWLKNNTNELDTATSWWDYGYWIESSLLSNRRASADGGHARDRDHIIAQFLANSGNKSEVDFESWQLNYMIVWNQDIYKFNAISYLGGAISRNERSHISMFLPFQKVADNLYMLNQNTKLEITTKGGQKKVIVTIPTQSGLSQGEPIQSIFVNTGEVIKGAGTFPYVAYIFPSFAFIAYYKISGSNFVDLAFFGGSRLPNFKLVHSTGDLNTYEFHPFALYRMEIYENKTWKPISKLGPGEYKARLYISAFGRNVKDAMIRLRAYKDGNLIDDEIIAQNVDIDHLNEEPLEVDIKVPNATRYELVLIQKGPVGALTEAPKLDGKIINPTRVLNDGQKGELELKAKFRKDYGDVSLYLRATVIYLVRTQGTSNDDENAVFEPHMDIIHYEKIADNLKTTNKEITFKGNAEFPNIINPYIEELEKKYGDKLTIRGVRVEPVFIADKEYVIYTQG
ncbi:peptide transporter [Palaeococcus sp. (in: euryarchaeotes)]